MKAISLWQPWASLIAIGAKTIETRSRYTGYHGPLAIAATAGFGKGFTKIDCIELMREEPFKSALRAGGINTVYDLPLGAVVATCELVKCVGTCGGATKGFLFDGTVIESPEWNFGDYSPGRCALILRNVQRLAMPVPAKGKQGFWEWTPSGHEKLVPVAAGGGK